MAKLKQIDERLRSVEVLRKALARLVKSCPTARDGCAVISGIGNQGPVASRSSVLRKA
jgi:hypothetical protein